MKKHRQRHHIDIIGFPMDLGSDRRGVDMGPSALRIAGLKEKLTALGYRVTDRGDLPIKIKERQKIIHPRLKYLKEIVRASEILARKVERSLALGHFPLCIGGDHSMAIGSIAGLASYYRQKKETLGVDLDRCPHGHERRGEHPLGQCSRDAAGRLDRPRQPPAHPPARVRPESQSGKLRARSGSGASTRSKRTSSAGRTSPSTP